MEVDFNIGEVLKTKGSRVETVVPAAVISEVCEKMRVKNVGALVVSRDGQHVDGIISERDIVLGLARQEATVTNTTAQHLMSRHVVTCELDDHLTKVMAVITNQRVRHHGKLAGMISIGDVLKGRLEEIQLGSVEVRGQPC